MSKIVFAFFITSLIAGCLMLFALVLFPLKSTLPVAVTQFSSTISGFNFLKSLTQLFTVSDFMHLFSKESILPLIIFSILVGLATSICGDKADAFAKFLKSGAHIFMQMIKYIMYYAPIAFFAYFAILAGKLGAGIFNHYLNVAILYYALGLFYFFVIFTLYAYIANKKNGISTFWKHVFFSAITALATCSSAASIPANLQTSKKMGLDETIYEPLMPLGGILHKEGSVMGSVLKIVFLFAVYHVNFSGMLLYTQVLFISILVGTIIAAIPSGGLLGEMVILSIFGFPKEALMMIVAISLIIDPLATMLNVTGDLAAGLLITRFFKPGECEVKKSIAA